MWQAAPVEVLREEDLQARYDRLVELVMRIGNWLSSAEARLLSPEEWERQFLEYRSHMEALRTAGDQLRPTSLRARQEVLTGDALADEVRELFAA